MFQLRPPLTAALAILLVAGCVTSTPSQDEEVGEIAAALSTRSFELSLDFTYGRIVVESQYEGADGFPLRFKWYENLGRDEAYVVFVNGRAEFLEKYDSLFTDLKEYPLGPNPDGTTLADLPISFFALDVSGQGASKEGRLPSHIDDFDLYVEDLRRLFSVVRKLERHRKPIYLMAHSQGGLVAARFVQAYPGLVDGLIVASPFWGFATTPDLPAEALRGLVQFYAQGVGLPRLCSQPEGVGPEVLGGIAQCASGALGEPCALCFADPESCDDETGAALLGAFQQLQAMGDQGCTDFGFECPLPLLTDDDEFCEFINDHPLSGPSPTIGYLDAAFRGQEAFAMAPPIDVPTLILTNPNDLVVAGESHTCDNISGECKVVSFETPAHELLTGLIRPEAVAEIRAFLARMAH